MAKISKKKNAKKKPKVTSSKKPLKISAKSKTKSKLKKAKPSKVSKSDKTVTVKNAKKKSQIKKTTSPPKIMTKPILLTGVAKPKLLQQTAPIVLLNPPAENNQIRSVSPKPPSSTIILSETPKPAAAPEILSQTQSVPIDSIKQITPAIEMLPEWEDRLRLRRVIFEDGLEFFGLGKGSKEYNDAYLLLNKMQKIPHSDLHTYFLICAKDRTGKIVGAIDGHSLSENLLVIGRSYASAKKRELHILLHAAALSGKKPANIICYAKLGDFSVETAGRLIFFGRGLGMSIIPLKTTSAIFLRRLGKELNPISNGAEIAGILELLKLFGELELDPHISEYKQLGDAYLIPLPVSPDSREHLHELRDVIKAISINADQLDAVMDTLRSDYVLGRMDITPELL